MTRGDIINNKARADLQASGFQFPKAPAHESLQPGSSFAHTCAVNQAGRGNMSITSVLTGAVDMFIEPGGPVRIACMETITIGSRSSKGSTCGRAKIVKDSSVPCVSSPSHYDTQCGSCTRIHALHLSARCHDLQFKKATAYITCAGAFVPLPSCRRCSTTGTQHKVV